MRVMINGRDVTAVPAARVAAGLATDGHPARFDLDQLRQGLRGTPGMMRRRATRAAVRDVEPLDGARLAALEDCHDTDRPVCVLREVDGALLGRGVLHDRYLAPGGAWVIIQLDAPGRMIQRCLLGDLRELWLDIAGAPGRCATVDRLLFVPDRGRLCVLWLAMPPRPGGTEPSEQVGAASAAYETRMLSARRRPVRRGAARQDADAPPLLA